jgi:small subunit ribosomal protein S5
MAIENIDEEKLKERVIHINRVAKVVKGGRRFSFSALVVVGDESGHVGVGLGKANEFPKPSQRATTSSQEHVQGADDRLHGSARRDRSLRCRPRAAPPGFAGTGVIAGGAVRAVVESAASTTS